MTIPDLATLYPAQSEWKTCCEQLHHVLWLSDGGRSFWRVYRQCFAHCAIGILDFYHTVGHLWRATTALLDGRSLEAHHWFKNWRSLLRHGHHQSILDALTLLVNTELTEAKDLETLTQVQAYFQAHHQHIRATAL